MAERKRKRRRGVRGVSYAWAAYGYPIGVIPGVQQPVLSPGQFPEGPPVGEPGGSGGEGGVPA